MKLKSLSNSALIVIDMQRYFLEKGAPAYLERGVKIIPLVKKLVNSFRNAGRPVIFTRHAHKKNNLTGQMGRWWHNKLPWETDKYSRLISTLKPKKREPVITKTRYSAFEKTNLNNLLKRKNVDTIVVCGVMTHLCVETTIRHAFMLDYQPILIQDACASENKKHHEAAIYNLAHGFSFIVDTNDVIDMLKNQMP